MSSSSEWFAEWFNSPYYHILYQNRNYEEAQLFIDNIGLYLNFLPNDEILDLACGKGRHSIYLNKKGLCVTGVDLSAENIAYAKQFENDRLLFEQHDMREVYKESYFDFILNLFTSFGYFETEKENQTAIQAMADSLNEDGRIVLDFFNTHLILKELLAYEQKELGGITFHIRKRVENGVIIKDIAFEDKGKHFNFQERVRAIPAENFIAYFRQAGLLVARIFGDYNLSEYEEESSERMIFIVEKAS